MTWKDPNLGWRARKSFDPRVPRRRRISLVILRRYLDHRQLSIGLQSGKPLLVHPVDHGEWANQHVSRRITTDKFNGQIP